MKTIVIEIEDQDIRQGVRKDACQCPIAVTLIRSIKSKIKKKTGNDEPDICIAVNHDEINFWDEEGTYIHDLFPVNEEDWYEIKNFIDNFDLGNDVEPFCVELKYN